MHKGDRRAMDVCFTILTKALVAMIAAEWAGPGVSEQAAVAAERWAAAAESTAAAAAKWAAVAVS